MEKFLESCIFLDFNKRRDDVTVRDVLFCSLSELCSPGATSAMISALLFLHGTSTAILLFILFAVVYLHARPSNKNSVPYFERFVTPRHEERMKNTFPHTHNKHENCKGCNTMVQMQFVMRNDCEDVVKCHH